MPKGSATSIFISSTCYDLSQLRSDIRDFAQAIGFEPILSEFDSFPINPSQNTIQNCLGVVRDKADIFVLIIGNRYGSTTEAGKSVTNLEYMEAVSRGIPIYVFVKREIISLLPIWKSNPNADFSATVDSPKLLEFVSKLRDGGEIWVSPFSSAQEIIQTLRQQLSYLFADSLALRKKIKPTEERLLAMSPGALQIYIERPVGWEFLVFAKLLQDGITSHSRRRLDLELGITFDKVVDIKDWKAAFAWQSYKVEQILQIVNSLTQAFNGGVSKAVGEPGQAGDIDRIAHVASRIAEGYVQIIEWSLEFHRLLIDPELEKLVSLASRFGTSVLREIEDFSDSLFSNVEIALAEQHKTVDITLKLSAPDTKDYLLEAERIYKIKYKN